MKSHNNNIEKVKANPLIIKWASYARGVLIKVTSFLQEKTERLSYTSKRIWLFVFCLLGIGCSLSVIAYSFVTIEPPFRNHSIRLPAHLSHFPHSTLTPDSLITVLQYHRIQQFEQYLKSQQNSTSGKLFYDSLLNARPHLLDSLQIIDSLFLSQ